MKFFMICYTSICKIYVIKFVVIITSLYKNSVVNSEMSENID